VCCVFYARQLYQQVLLRAHISYGNSVRPSVCPSVMTRYQIKLRWDRDSGSSPYDSLESLVSYEVIWCHWVRRFPSNEGIKEGSPLRNRYFTTIGQWCRASRQCLGLRLPRGRFLLPWSWTSVPWPCSWGLVPWLWSWIILHAADASLSSVDVWCWVFLLVKCYCVLLAYRPHFMAFYVLLLIVSINLGSLVLREGFTSASCMFCSVLIRTYVFIHCIHCINALASALVLRVGALVLA